MSDRKQFKTRSRRSRRTVEPTHQRVLPAIRRAEAKLGTSLASALSEHAAEGTSRRETAVLLDVAEATIRRYEKRNGLNIDWPAPTDSNGHISATKRAASRSRQWHIDKAKSGKGDYECVDLEGKRVPIIVLADAVGIPLETFRKRLRRNKSDVQAALQQDYRPREK